MAAGLASMVFTRYTALMVDHFGYGFVLTLAGAVAPLGALLLYLFAGRIRRLHLPLTH